jgi:hypothetical protein
MHGSPVVRRLGQALRLGIAFQLATLGALKLLGDHEDAWFSPATLRAMAVCELALAAAVFARASMRPALWLTLCCVCAWLAAGWFAVPAHAKCGCMGGIAAIESHRNLWSAGLGLMTVWALWATQDAASRAPHSGAQPKQTWPRGRGQQPA